MNTLLENMAQDVVDADKVPARIGKHLVRAGNLCHVAGPVNWTPIEQAREKVHASLVSLYAAMNAMEKALRQQEAAT